MSDLLQRVLTIVQGRNRATCKPENFPISSLEEMDQFENIDDNAYAAVVSKKKLKIVLLF